MQDMMNLVNSGVGDMIKKKAIEQAGKFIPTNEEQYSGYMGKIFNKEIRQYFDVDTQTVYRKLIKLLFPFKEYDWDEEIKKLDLYIPTVSFMTLVLFSTIIDGISQEEGKPFNPKIGRKVTWIILLTILEIVLARCSENFISHLNIGFVELSALVSYRFVPIALVTLQLVITNMSIPYLPFICVIYVLLVDTYFCKLELSNYAKERFAEQGVGSKICLGVHFLNTVLILWVCSLL